jgi:pleckstrin homology domain-containing family A member 1/2
MCSLLCPCDEWAYCMRQDTKPHRSIPLAQLLDALEYDLPTSRHHPPAQAMSPPHHSQHPVHAADEQDGTAGAHTFKIVTTKRTLLLCAPSEEEEIKWLSAVRALIARRSVVPGDSAAASTVVGAGAGAGSVPAAGGSAGAAATGAPAASRSMALPGPSMPATASLDAQAAHIHHQHTATTASVFGSSANSGTPATSPTPISAPLPSTGGGVASGAHQQHRRQGSFARRLSLSTSGVLLGGSANNSASMHAVAAATPATPTAGVPQEA